MRPSEALTGDEKIIATARERRKVAGDGWSDIYKLASEDMQFVYDVGEGQWPEKMKADRIRDDRPVLTINKLQKFVRTLRGDAMQNRPRMKVIPVDSKSDPKMAKLYDGLIREIEYLSNASTAYDTAYGHAISSSIGFYRLITEFCDTESFDQSVLIKRILNPMSVHFDPNAVEFEMEDARYCFVEEFIDVSEHESRWPDADASDFTGSGIRLFGDWLQGDRVRVAEYFYKEPVQKTLVQIDNGETFTLSDQVTPEFLQASGNRIIRDRVVQTHVVRWVKMNGIQVLEKADWPGNDIPIIPVFGDEIVVEGKRYYLSLLRGAKGSQQMYNYWARISNNTNILTPTGWKLMRNIHVGDKVFDEKGKPCSVLGESPTFTDRKCYKITFDGKASVVADDEHLWTVVDEAGFHKITVHTTDLVVGKHFVEIAKPLELPEKDLKISPYTLGLWLAGGNSGYPEIFAHKKTADELRGYLEADGCVLSPDRIACKETETHSIYCRGLRKHLVHYGLLNNKQIPEDYLRASYDQRLELLQGLMDGDGSATGKGGRVRFATKSIRLALDMSELLKTLGYKGIYNQQMGGMWCFSIAPHANMDCFKLGYKLARQHKAKYRTEKRHGIVKIERVKSVPVKCIKVDSPSHLFLAGESMIPTHNTAATETVALTPKMPFMVDHRQIKGFETEWEEANRTNRMYIRYNAIQGLERPKREKGAEVPAAIMAMMRSTAFDIEDHLGRYEASKGQASNERSRVAIVARIQQSDKGTFTFVDNFKKALMAGTRQLIDLIPKVYDTQRALRVMDESGNEHVENVNVPVMGKNESVTIRNDLRVGKYDLIATVGVSFGSKREEMVDTMIKSMQFAPLLAPVIAPLVFKYSDVAGSEEIYQEVKKYVDKLEKQGGPPSGKVAPKLV